MLSDPNSIIDALGGTGAVSTELGKRPALVSGWRKRGIPSEHWFALADLARRRRVSGVTLESLALLGAKKATGAAPAEECAR